MMFTKNVKNSDNMQKINCHLRNCVNQTQTKLFFATYKLCMHVYQVTIILRKKYYKLQ